MNLVEFPADIDTANGITTSVWTGLNEMICVDLLNFAADRHDLEHGDRPVSLGRLKS